jgi:DNA-binding transcriptional MerR regulator
MVQKIGQVAQATGIAARTIRFYEAAGVLPVPTRSPSGYRQYPPEVVRHLMFVRRARVLGLSLPRLKTLLAALRDGRGPARPRVREVVRAQLAGVRARIRELQALEVELVTVLDRMPKRSAGRAAGSCPCLDPGGAAQGRGRRDAGRRR